MKKIKKYLINDICTFKPMFEVRKKKIDIISCCLFRMKNHYKNFDKYVNGLQVWADYLNKPDNNYIFRLFVDNHIYNDEKIQKILSTCPYIEIILFECANFMEDDYHIDVFGALIRFFPLFNFKYNDSKAVTVVDIELNLHHRDKIDIILKLNTKKIILSSAKIFELSSIPYFVAGVMHFPDKKFDKKILLNFIKDAPKIKDLGHYNKRLTPFGYGTDEIFLNNYFIKHITTASFITSNNPQYFLYHYKEIIINNKNSLQYMKFILGKYAENKNLNEMLHFFDEAFYDIKLGVPIKYKTNINNYLATRFYKFLRYCIKNNITWIPTAKVIIDNYNNIIFSYSIIEFNLITNKIINITNIKPIMVN